MLHRFSCVLLCAALWQNSICAQEQQTPPAEIAAPDEMNLIHHGDLIDVDVIGSLEYDWRGTLNPEGFLNGVDFTENPIYALCRSEDAVAEEIAKAYGKILREPKVVVKILDRSNRPLSILYGAVKTPQRLQIKRPVFLNELLILSGGLLDNASGEIQIYRPQSLTCQSSTAGKSESNGENRARYIAASQSEKSNLLNVRVGDLLAGKSEANPQILSGDVITVQAADAIYVIGGVATPKQISARGEMTVSRAVASAGGVSKNGDAKRITIYRREAGETKIIEADLDKIKSGQTDDVILKRFDVVEVQKTGREKRKFPPIVNDSQLEKNTATLPLRVID